MICLDSNFIVDILRKRAQALQKLNEHKSDLPVTTIINLYELMSGIWAIKDKNYEKHLNILNDFLTNITILKLDKFSVEKAAKLYGELSQKGKIIDDLDILIAAICLSNGCYTLITKDAKHFLRIKGLKVETY